MKYLASCLIICCLITIPACSNEKEQNTKEPTAEVISLKGIPLYSSAPSESLLKKFELHKSAYEADPDDPDKLIWYGRFMAYQGKYNRAIEIFTKGIQQFPNDARMYRHRGHRYITTRKFEEAIADFRKAVSLIEGKENEIEPDGMPNAQNIPVSTLHGNIWYHLGLAYYLVHDFPNALASYQKCLETSSNPDNVVSASNWLYMISRRMDDETAAEAYLEGIEEDMEVIENFNYHDIDLFYKGELPLEVLLERAEEPGAGADAIRYAIGNWYLYTGKMEQAKEVFEKILQGSTWASFGYIAAEKDYVAYFM